MRRADLFLLFVYAEGEHGSIVNKEPILSLLDARVSCFFALICHPFCAAKRQPGGRRQEQG